ncbi:hypothetical protein PR048_027792 [Dryococelus australis]|uniref:Uncharacterized protein n=1 Tax=Dryococelus australis TaxID=614101 RepID=A0ABQ9GHH8_9NEOP|nr:hypothetical protein PR048_027792 [Dryococelus australis]
MICRRDGLAAPNECEDKSPHKSLYFLRAEGVASQPSCRAIMTDPLSRKTRIKIGTNLQISMRWCTVLLKSDIWVIINQLDNSNLLQHVQIHWRCGGALREKESSYSFACKSAHQTFTFGLPLAHSDLSPGGSEPQILIRKVSSSEKATRLIESLSSPIRDNISTSKSCGNVRQQNLNGWSQSVELPRTNYMSCQAELGPYWLGGLETSGRAKLSFHCLIRETGRIPRQEGKENRLEMVREERIKDTKREHRWKRLEMKLLRKRVGKMQKETGTRILEEEATRRALIRSNPRSPIQDDAAGRRIFSGMSRFPRPCIPALIRTHLASPSSTQDLDVGKEGREDTNSPPDYQNHAIIINIRINKPIANHIKILPPIPISLEGARTTQRWIHCATGTHLANTQQHSARARRVGKNLASVLTRTSQMSSRTTTWSNHLYHQSIHHLRRYLQYIQLNKRRQNVSNNTSPVHNSVTETTKSGRSTFRRLVPRELLQDHHVHVPQEPINYTISHVQILRLEWAMNEIYLNITNISNRTLRSTLFRDLLDALIPYRPTTFYIQHLHANESYFHLKATTPAYITELSLLPQDRIPRNIMLETNRPPPWTLNCQVLLSHTTRPLNPQTASRSSSEELMSTGNTTAHETQQPPNQEATSSSTTQTTSISSSNPQSQTQIAPSLESLNRLESPILSLQRSIAAYNEFATSRDSLPIACVKVYRATYALVLNGTPYPE